MYYCFVESDINSLTGDDSLMLQVKYAKRLGRFYCCRIPEGKVIDGEGQPIDVAYKRILLRATCPIVRAAAELLESLGANLIETVDNIESIEHWERLAVQRREIIGVDLSEVVERSFSPKTREFLKNNEFVFLKSRQKGFSLQTSADKLLSGNKELLAFLEQRIEVAAEGLLLSKRLNVKRDSLGRRESRHFVLGGKIMNSSRAVHSVQHTVPRSHREQAGDFVAEISKCEWFPQNYVIDVGEFETDGTAFTDIIEINPIGSSLCYVNNSIFQDVIPEIVDVSCRMNIGVEYCYDAMDYPERYVCRRTSNASFEYVDTEHHEFF